MSGVDVSSVVDAVSAVVAAVGLVGMAWLLLDTVRLSFVWIRKALGFGASVASPSADSEADFWDKYNAGDAVEGVDFVTEPLVPHYVSVEEYEVNHGLGSARLDEFETSELGIGDVAAQTAAMEDMVPGAQGSLFVFSGAAVAPSVGTTGGDSYYSADDDMDMDPSSLSDSQRRAMWG